MAKRFTATEKWEDPWFRSLKPPQKLLWLYLLDRCDLAGVLDLDLSLAEFCIGAKVNLDEFGDRVVRINGGTKVWIRRFIEFQYKCPVANLNPAIPVHAKVLEIVKKYGLDSIPIANDTHPGGIGVGPGSPMDMEEEEDKDKDTGKDKDKAKTVFGEFKNVRLSNEEYRKLVEKLGAADRLAAGIEILSAYKENKGKKYRSDYAAFHSWVIDALEKREMVNATHQSGGQRVPIGREIFTRKDNKRIADEVEALERGESTGNR